MADRHREDWVYEGILQRLSSGAWTEGLRIPTTRQFAKAMGVSHLIAQAAVRRAGRHKLLAVRQRQPVRVLPGAAERAARILSRLASRSKAGDVAILLPEGFRQKSRPPEPYFATLVDHLIREGARRSLRADVVLWPLHDQISAVMSLRQRGYRAAVFLGLTPDHLPSLMLMHEQMFPLIVFNRHIPGLKLPTVSLAEFAGAQRIAEHFISRGHRNLCMVVHCGSATPHGRMDRVAGWVHYLTDQNLLGGCIMPVYIVPWHPQLTAFGEVFVRLMHSSERPTAILFANSGYAKSFFANRQFTALGIPEDISMAMFEPAYGATSSMLPPTPLTRISTHFPRTAQCLIEQVGKMLEGDLMPPSIRVPMEITLTDSIGPVPADITPVRHEAS